MFHNTKVPFSQMNSRPLLVVCGGPNCGDSYSIRSDNLATIMAYDGVKTIPSKNCCGINDKYILSMATSSSNSDSKILINRHMSLQNKGQCTIDKTIDCIDVAGGYVAAGTNDGRLLMWRASDGELVVEQNLNLGPLTVVRIDTSFWILYASSSTGRTGGWCIPDLFSSSTPVRDWSVHSLRINDMVISTGQRVFTVGNDKVLKCYDFAAGCEILSVSFENELTSVCLAHNESVVYVGDVTGGIYPVQLATEVDVSESFEGHEVAITDLAISDDDRSLYSISLDSTIRRWDVSSGATVGNVTMKDKPFALRWLPIINEQKLEQPKGKRSKEQRQAQQKGFPNLKKTLQTVPRDELISAQADDFPILSLDDEAAIAIADVCLNRENQDSIKLGIQN